MTDRRALLWPLAAVAAITLWRILCLALNRVDLFMDEAQYWLWGQEPAFGYYSKPPLIGWAIRASTEIGGSDAPFWIRLPGPVAYGIAAAIVSVLALRVWRRPEAAWAGFAFATLPGVAVLSQFMSTDALLFPCFALALLAWIRLDEAPSAGWAATLGIAVGLGLLAKYAMIYFVALAAVSRVFGMGRGVPAGQFLMAALLALAIFAPNVWWNLENGFITLGHTAANAGWSGIAIDWAGAAAFLAVQLAAFGPVFAAAYVLAVLRPGGRLPAMLILFSLTLFAAIALQALIRHANGNWAAPAFLAGTALAVPWLLLRSRAWGVAGLALNALLAVALPLTTLRPEAMVLGGRNVFERTMGVADLSRAAIETAREAGLGGIAAADRMVLADLVYRARDTGIAVYAWPVPEVPNSHYALTRPLTAAAGTVLLVISSRAELPSGCDHEVLGTRTSEVGSDRIREMTFHRLQAPC